MTDQTNADRFRHLDAHQEREATDAPVWLSADEATAWANGYNAALACLNTLHVLTWTANRGDTATHATRSQTDANAKFDEWVALARPGDRIDLVTVSLDGRTDLGRSHRENSPRAKK